MQIELVPDKKYTFGKRVFWFLFFKHNFKAFLFLLLLIATLYEINTERFLDWYSGFDTIITIGMLNLWTGTLIFCVLLLIFAATFERYIQHRFILGEHSFHIRRGIFMIKEKVIPYRHIQNVDIDQPYHYRIFGLAKLDVTTARTDNFEDEKTNLIPLIDKKLAKRLSEFLIKQGVISHHNAPRPTIVEEIEEQI